MQCSGGWAWWKRLRKRKYMSACKREVKSALKMREKRVKEKGKDGERGQM
jgi:hypothetical protein